MSSEMIRKFVELIREKTRFKPLRRKKTWWLRTLKARELLELPMLPKRTKRRYFDHLDGDFVPLSDILEYMHFSLEDRELGDLFQIKKRQIFNREPFVAWRNPHYVVDYLDPLDYVPAYLSKQTRAMVDVVRLLDSYGVRGESESEAGDYLYGFPFRADYAVYQLSRILFLEYDEPHHEERMRDLLVDRAKASLNRTQGYAYLSIKESSWYAEGGRDYYLRRIADHIEKYHLEGLLAGFRRFQESYFEVLQRALGDELLKQFVDTNFGFVVPYTQIVDILQLTDEQRTMVDQRFNQTVETVDEDAADDDVEDVIDLGDEDDDEDDDDESDDDQVEERICTEDDTENEYLIEGVDYREMIDSDDRLLNFKGMVKITSLVGNRVSHRLHDAAIELFIFSFDRLQKLAPTSLTKEEHHASTSAISRVARIKADRKIERLEDEIGRLRQRLEDAGLEITTG